MPDEKVPMTVHGKKLLDEELKHLMTVERPTIIKAIEVARGHGDLSENADYSAAKERQSFIEGRIGEINSKLARAQVIDPAAIKSDKIVFGATVDLEDQESGQKPIALVRLPVLRLHLVRPAGRQEHGAVGQLPANDPPPG